MPTGFPDTQGTRPNTFGAGHIQRSDLVSRLLDAHHCNEFTDGEIGLTFTIRVKTLSGTTEQDVAIPKHIKCQVIDAWCIQHAAGGAADTAKLQKLPAGVAASAADISDAMDLNKADKVLTRVGTLDDAQWELDGTVGDVLRVTTASDATAFVFIRLQRVP